MNVATLSTRCYVAGTVRRTRIAFIIAVSVFELPLVSVVNILLCSRDFDTTLVVNVLLVMANGSLGVCSEGGSGNDVTQ